MRDDLKNQGYSKEDEYFYRKDRELLAKLREKANSQRQQLEAENKKREYWMRCPKCGSPLKEESYGGVVLVDRCSNSACGGVFFDGHEYGRTTANRRALTPCIVGLAGGTSSRSVSIVTCGVPFDTMSMPF